jgi:hypothetical protein
MTKSILAVLLVCAGVECVLGALPTMPDSFYLETYGAPPLGMPARTFRRLWYHKSDGVVKYHEYFHAPDSSQVEHKWEHWYDGSKNTTHLWEKVFLPAPSGGTKCNKIAVVAQQTTPPLCVWGDQRYSWSAKSTGTCQRYNQDSTTCDKYTASNSYNGISSNFEVYYLPGTNTPVSMKTTVMVVVSFWMYVVNWDPTVATATQNLTIPTDCLPPPPVVQSSSSPSPFSSDTHSDPAVISSSSDEDDDSKSDTTPSDSHGTPSDSHETPSDSHVTPSDSHATPSDSHATPSDSHATPSDSHEAHSSSPTHSSPAQSSHTHSSPAHSDAPSGSDSNVPPSSDTSDEASDSKKSSGAAQESYSIESKASNDSHNDSDSDSDNEIAGATTVSLSALAIAAVTATLFL